jgi:hypothetical protein
VLAVAALIPATSPASTPAKMPKGPTVTTFATGLNNPRGLAFGPNGALYVAEGGLGGTQMTTSADCTQVPAPIGPYSGGFSARISKIDKTGARTTVVDGLPSSQTSSASGSLVSGVSDVAFIGHTLYALEAGAGCSHGLKGTDNLLVRVNPDGSTTQIADLSAFLKSHPVKNPDAGDFEPDGTWYSMVAVHGVLYATEPNHQEVDRINPKTGRITRVVDLSKTFVPPAGWQGPTAITYKGNFFFGTLGTFPVMPGTDAIYKLTPSGRVKPWATGLSTVVGVVFDKRDRLYVLESMTAPGLPGPGELGKGKVFEIDPSGKRNVIDTGLSFPTAMTLGPDGALYVSNVGFGGLTPGAGQILRIAISK